MRLPVPKPFPDADVARWYVVLGLNGLALACALWVFLSFSASRSPADASLVAALVLLAGLVIVAWGRFRLTWGGDDDKPSLAFGFHVLLFVVAMHVTQNQTLLDRGHGLWTGGGAGLLLGIGLVSANRPVSWPGAVLTVGLMAMAGWTVFQAANGVLDNAPGVPLRLVIVDRMNALPHCSRSRGASCSGFSSHLVKVSPSPAGFPPWLGMSRDAYEKVAEDRALCFVQHPGRFGARWFTFDRCPKGTS